MLGAQRPRHAFGEGPFVGDIRSGETDREGPHRPVVQPRHHGQDGGRVDAARQKHAIGYVRALMDIDAVGKGAVQLRERIGLAAVLLVDLRQRRPLLAVCDPSVLDDQRLARQNSLDALPNRFASRGELKLQQLDGTVPPDPRGDQPGADDRLRFRCENQPGTGLGIVERLDAERVARQHQPSGRRVVDRDGVHAAKPIGEAGAVAVVEVQRRLAVRLGPKRRVAERRPEFDVVVDLAIRGEDDAIRAGQRLGAAVQIDDREARVDQPDAGRHVPPRSVGSTVGKRRLHRVQRRGIGRGSVGRHDPRDPAHQRTNLANSARYSSTTDFSVNRASKAARPAVTSACRLG